MAKLEMLKCYKAFDAIMLHIMLEMLRCYNACDAIIGGLWNPNVSVKAQPTNKRIPNDKNAPATVGRL